MFAAACASLDDFLNRDLSPEQEQLFRAHLLDCAACNAAVQQHERLNTLLRHAVLELDPPSVEVVFRFRARMAKARRRRFLAYAVSASAAAAVILLLIQKDRWVVVPEKPEPAPPIEIAAVQEKVPPAQVRISFANESKLVVVPEKTDSPDVTFVWVYPNQRSEYLASARDPKSPHFERNGK
jgi:Putative zinc-finger